MKKKTGDKEGREYNPLLCQKTDLEAQKGSEDGGKGEIKKVGPMQKSTGCWCEEKRRLRRRRRRKKKRKEETGRWMAIHR